MKWVEKKVIHKNKKLFINYTEFINGLIIYISDTENKLGTIGIGVPLLPSITSKGGATNSIVFGIKNELITKTLAQKIARMTNKIVIMIIHLSDESINNVEIILKTLLKSLEDEK